MDTKDTAETTAPSLAPPKPALKPKVAAEPEPENPVPSVPLSGLKNDSLGTLGAAFSELRVGTPDGKKKEKEKEPGKGGAKDSPKGEHEPSEDAPSGISPPRGRQAQSKTLQHPLLQPLYSVISKSLKAQSN